MKITSYEISKKLAEIGFKANTDRYYNIGTKEIIYNPHGFMDRDKFLKCYDLETLLDALPKEIAYDCPLTLHDNQIYYDNKFIVYKEENESLADTAARLLLLLIEKGLLTFNK